MKLSKENVTHIAELARLELSEQDLNKYGSQLSYVVDWIDQLKEVDATGVEPTAQVTGLENVMREDKVEDWNDEERKKALAEAPEMKDGQIKVKRILDLQ